MQDRQINGQTAIMRHIELAKGSVCKVYVKFFNEKAGTKGMRSLFRQIKLLGSY